MKWPLPPMVLTQSYFLEWSINIYLCYVKKNVKILKSVDFIDIYKNWALQHLEGWNLVHLMYDWPHKTVYHFYFVFVFFVYLHFFFYKNDVFYGEAPSCLTLIITFSTFNPTLPPSYWLNMIVRVSTFFLFN